MTGTITAVSTAVLRAVPLFTSFTDEQLRSIATMVKRRSVTRNTTIMAAGDPTDSLYIVLSGRLKVMMSDADGREVILTILGPGEFFGEMGLIDDSPRSASVLAIEPCELLSITKRDFKQSMEQNFELAMTVMRGLVRRLRDLALGFRLQDGNPGIELRRLHVCNHARLEPADQAFLHL